ncbi:MAG TPA: hypothetical protein VGC77_12010 [Rhodopseudomonas sp.]|uniref:His-rich protein BRANT n=1 Tax=Rhodopseudomonas sp. TaxID=1078 RepID=UPI002ED7B85F
MIKTMSAALLAVSMLAAPALAAGPAHQTSAPVAKSETAKPAVLNAQAKMVRHHHVVRHHRAHKRIGAHRLHHVSHNAVKSLGHTVRHG